MLKFLHRNKNKSTELMTAATGNVINIEEVNDEVFSQKMMGEGFGIHPNSGIIYSPISGIITMVAATKHGLGIKSEDGLEILIHMGIDTVELKGIPFKINVKIGDEVQSGQVIAQMNINEITSAGKDPTVIVVITNTQEKVKNIKILSGEKKAKAVAAIVQKLV
ncbi:PTS glucose transporter subunit IIA [Bombilactobacillus bombi]|uniref:PTS glucose transporter subunit IIA n=1 Tax=Bombilactobacillus bombi TaxID=1303590 RepID=A0A3R7CPI9_9LACO|nr:PTS glucose transporter subunit IIA [Bombilactobacillus bombi]RHW51199.1 PTS glucose transporter subunit IIA [Bombilactobacillus bombi]